ncbi:MAG: NAD-dependent epimerase/dehydratase family protein [Candidatus Hadarchaeales archaeon]
MAGKIGRILVTGGLGFIGSHTVDLLIEKGYEVRILDNLEPQVHGFPPKVPEYYNTRAELMQGDAREREKLKKAIEDVDAIIHLAAAVGIGQSMYQIEKYVSYNTGATASLLDILVNEPNDVKKLVVASSMSIYGEGKYVCDSCGIVYPDMRDEKQLKLGNWEPKCPNCGKSVNPVPTDEKKPLAPSSVYAQTKRHQEEMCLLIGKTYGIPTVALRYFNVYGPRQSLSNPYTGVCAIFSSRILNGKPPYVFEDGKQMRDFVHVKDVARANLLALEHNAADYMAVNIGTGKPVSVEVLARMLAKMYQVGVTPYISNRYRKGDIRHCYADITKASELLGYRPTVSLEEGLKELADWARAHNWAAVDLFEKTMKELEEKKLL